MIPVSRDRIIYLLSRYSSVILRIIHKDIANTRVNVRGKLKLFVVKFYTIFQYKIIIQFTGIIRIGIL